MGCTSIALTRLTRQTRSARTFVSTKCLRGMTFETCNLAQTTFRGLCRSAAQGGPTSVELGPNIGGQRSSIPHQPRRQLQNLAHLGRLRSKIDRFHAHSGQTRPSLVETGLTSVYFGQTCLSIPGPRWWMSAEITRVWSSLARIRPIPEQLRPSST